jgi:O-antigen ligase
MTAVKWAIFIVVVLSAPFVGSWLRRRPRLQLWAWTLVGFLPFFAPLDMGLVVFRDFPGDTHGLVFAVLDALALTLLFAQERPAGPLPYRFALTAYVVVALASVAQAQWWLGAFGYVWTLARMYVLYAAVCRASHDGRVPAALLRGLSLGVVYELGWVVYQHFGLHIHRATGTLVHENTLGMMVNLVVMAPIALLLVGRGTKLSWLAALAAPFIAFFTVSRGAILFLGVGVLLVYALSALRRYDLRKVGIGLVALVLAAAVVPMALATLSSRSRQEQDESMQTRAQLEQAASLMLEDHPLGVGPSHFVMALLVRGYGDRAGVGWYNWTSLVHNIYRLTAAEMGYAGLAALLVLFLTPLLSALRWGLRMGPDPRADLLLGLGVGLAAFYVHSLFEWTWRIPAVTYVYWIVVGMVGGLTRQLREARLRRRAPLRARFPVAELALRPEGAVAVARGRVRSRDPGWEARWRRGER